MEKSHIHIHIHLLLLLHILFLHCLLVCLAKTSPSITTDLNALLALKNAVTLDPTQTLAANWTGASSVCDWIGVTCSPLHHRVTSLNISNMGLTGTIPPQLGNLSFLGSLNLSLNNFYGELPHELGRLNRLHFLNIRANNFSGEVPISICKMSNLETLVLANNSLEGTIPSCLSQCRQLQNLKLLYNNLIGFIPKEIGNLTMLQTLTFGGNHLTGFIPKEIGNLTMLQTLSFRINHLTGVIPKELGNLKNLDMIYLDDNNLHGSIPVGIFNLSRIRIISIERNNLSGTFPSDMAFHLPQLEGIYLSYNSLSGPIPHSISNSSVLKVIQMYQNKFSGSLPHSLGLLEFLDCINLYSNNLTSSDHLTSFIDSVVMSSSLTHLGLSDNPLNSILPGSFGNLSTSIKRIHLRNCKIKGNIPNSIGTLTSLYLLDMGGNHLAGFIPPSIKNMQTLQTLNLADNNLNDRVSLVNLCRVGTLFEIDMTQNQISGSIPECLASLTSLRNLYLGSNRLDSSIPPEFWNLKDLLILNLSSNSLTGSLPTEVGDSLKHATVLDLSMNQISGQIPTSIGGLQSVQYLNLHGNRLEGSIPESIGSILSLEYLDLSHNNLSGLIPKSLESVQSLKYFNVSFNHLSGEIPSEGPFGNLTSASFDANGELCGGTSSKFHAPPCRIKSGRQKVLLILLIIFLVVGAIMGALALCFVYLRYKRKDKVPGKKDLLDMETQDRISYYELLKATDGYSESNLLGTGSFGSVYKATFSDGRILAIKVFHVHQENAFKSFEAECLVLRDLHHRNLIKVISSCSNLDFKALVLEFMPNGNLDTWLHCPEYFLDILQRLNIMIDVACALDYLHFGYSTPVVHCDLKPSNVLLDKDMVAHISDFGIARLLSQEESMTYTQTLATMGYVAPEYGLEGQFQQSPMSIAMELC